jgi:hypothetical protein
MPRDAELPRHNLVFGGVAKTHDHDAVMRISGESPGSGTILWNGKSQVPPAVHHHVGSRSDIHRVAGECRFCLFLIFLVISRRLAA